jgi:hypothetical protein
VTSSGQQAVEAVAPAADGRHQQRDHRDQADELLRDGLCLVAADLA